MALGAHGSESEPGVPKVEVPLASTWMLSTKKGKEAYVEPVIGDGGYRFAVRVGRPRDQKAAKRGTKVLREAYFRCLMSGAPLAPEYIKSEGRTERMGKSPSNEEWESGSDPEARVAKMKDGTTDRRARPGTLWTWRAGRWRR